LRDSTGLSVIGRSGNTAGDPADIAAGTDGHVLRRSGTDLGFGTIATGGVANNAIDNTKLRDSTGLSVIGRSGNTAGDPADIVAGTDGHVLRRFGTLLEFGTITGDGIAASTITGSKIATSTITGSKIAASTITNTNIASSTITGTNIASSTITSTNLAADSVNSSEIVDGAVDEVHLSNTLCAELTLTAINGWSGTVYYWILGNMVFGQVALTNGLGYATSGTFATLPSGYRPQRSVRFGAAASDSRELFINTSGSMICSTSNAYFDASFHFLIN
jgi:hypothetical protein